MNRKLFFLCAFVFSLEMSSAQNYTHVYYLNDNLKVVKKSKSTITGKGYFEDNMFKLNFFRNDNNLLCISAHFIDTSLSFLQGLFQSYYDNNQLQTEGNYIKDEKYGIWQTWNEMGQKTDSAVYDNGKRLVYAQYFYSGKNKKLVSFKITDSLKNTFNETSFSEDGILTDKLDFAGQKGLSKTYDSTGTVVKIDSFFTREEIEASFPGGNTAWTKYIQKCLDGFNPAENGAPPGIYKVIIRFRINKDGNVDNLLAETNYGYEMEEKFIKCIQSSPQWVPANQYGRKVNAYRRQPSTFYVQKQ